MSDVVGDPIVERVAEALHMRWFVGTREWVSLTGLEREHWRNMARAAIEAIGLPVIWGFGIPNELGWFDANANTFHTKADAEKAMRQHDKIFPDDRRCLAWRFGMAPWERVGGDT